MVQTSKLPSQAPGPVAEHLPRLFSNKRSRLVLLGALVAGAAVLYGATAYFTTRRPARTMTDATFERRADALCANTLPGLRAVRTKSGSDAPPQSLSALATKVDKVSDDLATFVGQLRAIPVLPKNTALVTAWFHQWDIYIATGHRYADAVRTGNDKRYSAVAKQGVAPVRAIAKFARGNHIDNCVP